MKKIMVFTIIALAFFACDDGNDNGNDKETPQPHESTITAFGKTTTVIGDAAISTADFNAAVGKLQEALIYIDTLLSTLPPVVQSGLPKMMERGITIIAGNAVPASVSGVLTVGVDYLKSNDMQKIADDIYDLADGGAFADPTPLYTNPGSRKST